MVLYQPRWQPYPKYQANFKGSTTAKGHTEGSEQPRSELHTHVQSEEVHTINELPMRVIFSVNSVIFLNKLRYVYLQYYSLQWRP